MKHPKPISRAPWQRPKPIPRFGRETDAELRALVRKRDDSRCVCCACRLGAFWECHHRQLRSRGGQDSACNLIALCPDCHRRIHGHPAWATEHGFMVSAYDDPAQVPVAYRCEEWRLLRYDGVLLPAGGAA